MLVPTWSRPAAYAALLVLAAACGRTTLKADPVGEGGGGSGAGGSGGGPAVCGNGTVEAGEACDDGNAINTDACIDCAAAECGDGFVQTGVEGCDDGNDDNFDACRNDCTPSTCGNGILEAPEQCDDGNDNDEDGCLSNCLVASCGDGFVNLGVEDCDDQNDVQTDACLNDCSAASCGDGFVWQGVEPCDDGNQNDNDGCRNNCSLPTCGDGQVDAGEQCDDGNNNNFDGCRNNCVLPFCGDVIVDPGEQCDDGNNISTDACISCVSAFCGDGFVRMGVEQCDDGNNNNFDGCRNSCQLPFCGDGITDPGEQCDDGNQNNFDGCRNTCILPFCGDGIADPGEQCDDGNNINTDACVQGCLNNVCGDGFLFNGFEQCDDGNLINGDGCSSSCQLPICGDGTVDPGEQCDLGAANVDRPALEVEQLNQLFAVMPVENTQDVAVFYDYFSASSHTGFEQVQTSRIYFYRQQSTELLGLITHHGVDFFPPQPTATVLFSLTGVPAVTSVAIADDNPTEWQKTSSTTVSGDWTFANNTDGGALTNLPFPGNWVITLGNTFIGGINSFEFIDQGINIVPLQLNIPVILRAYDTPSACRLDCTVPSCGDGVVDGGEVCDDGNNIGGDGCAADCSSLAG